MNGATRTTTDKMKKPSGKTSNKSQKYPIPTAHKRAKLIN